jgi:uncharacterized membrane protein
VPEVPPPASLEYLNPAAPARGGARPVSPAERWHKAAFIFFLLTWTANWVVVLLQVPLPAEGRWIEVWLLGATVLTTLVTLSRRLPLQNVLTAAVLIGGLGGILIAIGAASGVPFGPIVYGDALGEKVFTLVPWPMPLLWVVLVMNGRGVARLIMRPWRRTNYYGFWVIGLTCALAVIFALGFEPFAVKVKNYWIWLGSKSVLSWHTAPWVNFLGWFCGCLGILAFTIPWLINKQPVKQPMDYHPLVVWTLVNLWVLTGNAGHGLWGAASLTLLLNGVAITYAIRGARW